MIIDLKYHIASLVAVFLALAMGILIGSAMLSDDTLAEGQKQLIDRVETRLNNVMKENKETRQENSRLQALVKGEEEFSKAVLPILIKGRLTGKTIAVISTNGQNVPEDLLNSLKSAGATVSSVTKIKENYEKDLEERLGETATVFGVKDATTQAVSAAMANVLVDVLTNGNKSPSWQQMNGLKLAETSGQYGVPYDTLVLVGGSRDSEDNDAEIIDVPMIKSFKQKGINIIGTEESNIAASYIKDYQKENLPTVDNVDAVPGQVALVYCIAGRPGQYGIKDTAKALIPALP